MIYTSFNRYLCCIRRKFLMKRLVLSMSLCMIGDGIMASDKVLIDNDHFTMYPYCGSMHYEDSEYSGEERQEGCMPPGCMSRAVNAINTTTWYRWLAVVEMQNLHTNRRIASNRVLQQFACTGAVITNR